VKNIAEALWLIAMACVIAWGAGWISDEIQADLSSDVRHAWHTTMDLVGNVGRTWRGEP